MSESNDAYLDERPCLRCDRTRRELIAFEVADREMSDDDVEAFGEPRHLWEVDFVERDRASVAVESCWRCMSEWERRVHLDQCIRCGRPTPENPRWEEEHGDVFELGWVTDLNYPIEAQICPDCLSYAEHVASAESTARDIAREREGGYMWWMEGELDFLAERERRARELEERTHVDQPDDG